MSEDSDAELVRLFLDGEQNAFASLVARHERRVYNLAYRMLGRQEDASDATQDTFLACFRRLPTFRQEAAFTTWLHRIAVNVCYDSLRKRMRDPTPMFEVPEPPPAKDPADQASAAVDVQRAIARVPPEFRAAVVLHDIQGLPYDEIAEILGIPVGTVKSRLHRGRVALGRALTGEPSTHQSQSNKTTMRRARTDP